jgi:hypothetical protein
MEYAKLNKRALLMRDYVILLVLFGVIAGIGGLIVSDVASPTHGYNVTNMTDSSFDSAYNQVSYTTELAETMGNESFSEEGMSTLGGIELLFGATKSVFQLVGGSLSMVKNTMTSMTTSFGIPLEIANLLFGAILSIIIILIVFVIISSLTKTKV